MCKIDLDSLDSYYFLGIGGVSMSALAKILIKSGKTVGGFDRTENEYIAELKNLGADVTIGNSGDAENYQAVVYTDAIPENNPTLIKARRNRKIIVPRGELLSEVCRLFGKTIAVAGCHGKTTCTAMIAHILGAAGVSFSSHIGGDDLTYSNGYLSGHDVFVTEACEYRKNFLRLKPDVAVILNSDPDHLDCYGTVENLKAAYAEFAGGAKEVVGLYGDIDCPRRVTFGFDDRADFYARKIKNDRGLYSFTAYEKSGELGRISLSVYGKHNILNALAALAACRRMGIAFDKITIGIENFKGVKRRFEKIGSFNGAECIADYAHHPNEIKAALKTAKCVASGELYVVFQPHTYSRTKTFFKQFVEVLGQLKRLLVYKTYAAREYYDDAGSALTLSASIKRSHYGDCREDILDFLKDAGVGDTVLFLGAGDIYEIAGTLTDG